MTITGPPGVGKSRLAVAIAGADGTLVDLATSGDAEALRAQLAAALGCAHDGPDPEAALRDAVRARGARPLVLDHVEHLCDPVRDVVSTWLPVAPELRLVIASRRAVELPAGSVHALGPLPVPRSADEDNAAVRLFHDHASPLAISDERARAAVVELVTRLEGIPLAIVIVARHTDVLSPEQLLAQLGDHARMRAPLGARHSTLHDAVAWSWQLLEPWEQRALAQCSVFEGGFDLEALRDVVHLPEDSPRDHVAVLRALHHHSLLTAAPGPDGYRYRLPRAVLDFAVEQRRPKDDAPERHRRHFAARAARLYAAFRGPDGHAVTDAIRREAPNLRAAMDRSREAGALDDALRCWLALAAFIHVARHPLRASIAARGRALLDLRAPTDVALRHEALLLVALIRTRSRPADAHAELEALIAEARAAGLKSVEGRARRRYADGLQATERAVEARRELEQAMECLAEAPGEQVELAKTEVQYAALLRYGGELEGARRVLTTALARNEMTRSRHVEVRVRTSLGLHALDDGDLDEAHAHFSRVVTVAGEIHNHVFEEFARGSIAIVTHERGQLLEADRGYERAATELAALGDPLFAQFHGYRALALWERGEIAAARAGLLAASETFKAGEFQRLYRLWSACLAVLQGEDDLGPDAAVWTATSDAQTLESLAMLRRIANRGHPAVQTEARRWAEEAGPLISAEARILRRLLAHLVDPAPVLRWDAERRAFAIPGRCPPTSLRTRATMYAVLAVLVAELRERPGRAIGVAELHQRGWPGERASLKSARNRVYVTVAKLRKAGLREALEKGTDGYRLDPRLRVEPCEIIAPSAE